MITYKVDLNTTEEPEVTGSITDLAKDTNDYVNLHNALSSLVSALDNIFHEGLIDSCIENGINLRVRGYDKKVLLTKIRFTEGLEF